MLVKFEFFSLTVEVEELSQYLLRFFVSVSVTTCYRILLLNLLKLSLRVYKLNFGFFFVINVFPILLLIALRPLYCLLLFCQHLQIRNVVLMNHEP